MTSNSTVVPLRQPDTIEDPLTAILRSGARRLLAQVIEAEADAFLAEMKGLRLPDGRERVVRHGYGPERLIQTGIGPVAVEPVRCRRRPGTSAAPCTRPPTCSTSCPGPCSPQPRRTCARSGRPRIARRPWSSR